MIVLVNCTSHFSIVISQNIPEILQFEVLGYELIYTNWVYHANVAPHALQITLIKSETYHRERRLAIVDEFFARLGTCCSHHYSSRHRLWSRLHMPNNLDSHCAKVCWKDGILKLSLFLKIFLIKLQWSGFNSFTIWGWKCISKCYDHVQSDLTCFTHKLMHSLCTFLSSYVIL